MSSSSAQKVLILSLSGIGNYLMQAPTIAALKKERPAFEIAVWVAPRGTKSLAQADPNVANVIEAPIRRSLLLTWLHSYNLARRHFDIGLMLSPGQLWKGAAQMFLAGIDQRIAHYYPHLGNPKSGFLLTRAIPEVEGLHDIEQNLRLLSEFGIDDAPYHDKHYEIPPLTTDYKREAEKLIAGVNLDAGRRLIGLHAGSASAFEWKRWPAERFADLAHQLINKHNAHIVLFGGPDEESLKRDLAERIGTHVSLVSGSLLATAGVMQQCALVVSNDSGLMHLSAATGTPTIGLFGPTDEAITGPRGSTSSSVRAADTEPVYNTETHHDLGEGPHDTMLALSVATVEQAATKYL